jgi:c-di-GMP-binding flagellar brake protein YcgR
MEIPEKRRSKRLKTSLPVTFQHVGTSKRYGETVTKDISVTGLRMNIDSFFPPNSNFVIKMRFPEVNKIIEVLARVVWSQTTLHSNQYQAGMEFTEINPIFKKWLEEYILINIALGK